MCSLNCRRSLSDRLHAGFEMGSFEPNFALSGNRIDARKLQQVSLVRIAASILLIVLADSRPGAADACLLNGQHGNGFCARGSAYTRRKHRFRNDRRKPGGARQTARVDSESRMIGRGS